MQHLCFRKENLQRRVYIQYKKQEVDSKTHFVP